MPKPPVKTVAVRNPTIIKDLTKLRRVMFKGSGKKGSLTEVAEQLLARQIEQTKAEAAQES